MKETIKEAAKKYPLINQRIGFIAGARWQQERSYSEEDLRKAFIEGYNVCRCVTDNTDEAKECFNEWFEQFKKK